MARIGGETEGYKTFYRVQRGTEHPDSLFDERRPDGWVDPESENYETQPLGVSACSSLADLRGYMDTYSLTPQKGDRLLRLHGSWGEEDADQFAVRVIVAGWEDIGDARMFWELTKEYSRTDLRKDPELTEEILAQCDGLEPNVALLTKRLWRAASDDYVDTGCSFAESKAIARAYLDNPGFGGATIFKTVVEFEEDQILDLRGVSLAKARRMADVPSASGAIGIDEWLPREPGVQEAFRAQGFLWALVDESFPEDTTTWIWLGSSSDEEPELEEA